MDPGILMISEMASRTPEAHDEHLADARLSRRRGHSAVGLDSGAEPDWWLHDELGSDERDAILLDAFHRRWRRSRAIRLVCMVVVALIHVARLLGAALWLTEDGDGAIAAAVLTDLVAVTLLVPASALALRRHLACRQHTGWIALQLGAWSCVTLSLVLHQVACSNLSHADAMSHPGGATTCRAIHANSIPVIPVRDHACGTVSGGAV